MHKDKDMRIARIERELSRLGALVSLAADDVAASKATTAAAEAKLAKLQGEIERLYIVLNEPFSVTME